MLTAECLASKGRDLTTRASTILILPNTVSSLQSDLTGANMMGRRTMQQQKNKHLFDWPADRRTVPLSPTSQQGVRTWLSRLLRRRLLQRLVSLLLVAILVSYFALYDLPKWRGTLTILGVQSTPPSTAYEAVNEAITTDLSNGHLPDFSLPSALPQIPAKIWQIYRECLPKRRYLPDPLLTYHHQINQSPTPQTPSNQAPSKASQPSARRTPTPSSTTPAPTPSSTT